MTDKEWNQLLGEFVFHLTDTHGLPKQITEDWFMKDGYLQMDKLILYLSKHKDFIRKWNKEHQCK